MNKFSSIKDLVSVSYGEIIGFGATAFFWFWLASEISPEAYGQIHFFLGIAGIISYIATVGTTNTITVYTAKKIPVLKSFFSLSMIIAFLGLIVTFFIYERVDVGFLVFGYALSFIGMGYLLGNKKYFEHSKYVLIQKVLTLALGILFYYFWGIDGIIFALAITYASFILPVYKGLKNTKLDFNQLKNRFGFVVGNYSMQLIGGLSGQLDKIIVAPILGFTLLGNYSLALSFFSIMLFLPNNLFKYLLPQESTGNQKNRVVKFSIILSIIIAGIAIIILPKITSYYFPEFTEVTELIQIMSVGIIPKTISSIYEAKLLGSENSKIVLSARTIHLVTMTISMISLGLIFGITGIAIAFLLANILKAIFLIVLHRGKFN